MRKISTGILATIATSAGLIATAAEAAGELTPMCVSGPFIVYFDWDRDQVTPQAAAILDIAAAGYQSCPSGRIAVAGHADRSGGADYNLALSARRASAVRAYIAGRNIPETVIETAAFGESRPLVETPDGIRESQNRRVEVYLVAGRW